jgi:GGDEF domain-containing protein
MWNVGEAQAVAKAAELEAVIARVRADYGPAQISVGASAGAVALVADATAAAVIDAADRAMYGRKKGRKR